MDRCQYGVEIGEHVGIPESQHDKPLRFQRPGPSCIRGLLTSTLRTIQFDDQLRIEAGEIGHVPKKRNLPSELAPCHLTVAQVLPEDVLGLRLRFAKYPRLQMGCWHHPNTALALL